MAGGPQLELPEIPRVALEKRIARLRSRFEANTIEVHELLLNFVRAHELDDELVAYLTDELQRRREEEDGALEVTIRVGRSR